MPWRILSAGSARCNREIRSVERAPVPVDWLLADDADGVLWPGGRADVPAGMRLCAPCREELQGLYKDEKRWEREAQTYDSV